MDATDRQPPPPGTPPTGLGETAPSVSAADFKALLGRYTTGVSIITCVAADGGFVGLTANSLAALSLDPPLVLWSLRVQSQNLRHFQQATHFAVNVLSQAQVQLSRRFASPAPDKFGEGVWLPGQGGAPLLAAASAQIVCETVSHQTVGDHQLFIGRVIGGSAGDAEPLVYRQGHYHALGDTI